MILFGAEIEREFFTRLEDRDRIGIIRSEELAENQPIIPLSGYPTVVAITTLVQESKVMSSTINLTVAETMRSAPFDMSLRFPMVLARISRFATLQLGWNGPNTVPPTPLSSTIAVHIVRDFAEAALAVAVTSDPQVAPLDDGGYQFEWRYRERELFVACNYDGILSILESAPDHEREYTGDRTAMQSSLHWLFAAP